MNRLVLAILGLPAQLVILATKCYQWLISPWLGPRCRFQPTCSNYMIASVQKYGAFWGALRGLRRISRCHPWSDGGYDPP